MPQFNPYQIGLCTEYGRLSADNASLVQGCGSVFKRREITWILSFYRDEDPDPVGSVDFGRIPAGFGSGSMEKMSDPHP